MFSTCPPFQQIVLLKIDDPGTFHKKTLQLLTATISFKINLNLPNLPMFVSLVLVVAVVIVTVIDFGVSVIKYTRVFETQH